MFSEHTWVLTLISAAMSVVLAVAIWKNFFRHPLGKLCLTLILGGAIGNLIDRALRGFVVDMFNVLFMHFAVFNVADSFVCVGAGLMVLYLILEMVKESKTEKAKKAAEAVGSAEVSDTEEPSHE